MVKATIKHKNLTELEGDVILGTAILNDAIGNSEAFIIGDVERSNIPVILAASAVTLLKEIFSGKELKKAYVDFHMAFHTVAEAAREEDFNEEETGKEN